MFYCEGNWHMRHKNKMAAQHAFAGASTSGNRTYCFILPAYSNVRPQTNQISHLQFCPCINSPVLYCCKSRKTGITTASFHHDWHCACAIMSFAILHVQIYIQRIYFYILLVSLMLPDPILGVLYTN